MSYVDTIYCGYMLSALFNLSSVAFRLVSAKVPEYNISLEPKPGKVIKLSLYLRVSINPVGLRFHHLFCGFLTSTYHDSEFA